MTDYQFKNQLEEFSYAMGLIISSNLLQSGVNSIDEKQFLDGFRDTFVGNRPKMSMEEANLKMQEYILSQDELERLKNREESKRFLANNLNNEGVVQTASGLQYKILRHGVGKHPKPDDQVRCHYHGVLLDGTVFDSSLEREEPAIFPISAVIQGWAEALCLMNEGAKWRLFIPAELAYGEQGAAGLIGPNSALVFDVELIEIV